ncbi:two-component system sensor histidine kinase CbrA [Pseudomonas aeruginosa]|uniref:two-component system sensor histidine kinase CbrA n=1 Tax=Pseudomonas aeruginosa TaxID=287 RepID=UPI0009377F44|nr:two-component system sensor histidine kinase CbrA [Pseudomonas aeruginosa]MEE2449778.1 two-component system sensor histidine kinase CbrA [Pseudomonas aeruginosa]MEE3548166.1 two-component system sensor histidine kinase CbrA [Pseudomonas aeruginosa]MEE3564711.1 two-component system sensor histidine kinase CbrA [Pseudomonas aeruginosa]
MLTSFSLTQLILISVAYLSTLFGIAWITERGYVPRRLVRHPLVYTLSLGVYASAWAFYGTVGLAYQYGYGFLAIYLGISGAFLLAPVLLYPILRVTRAYQLSSLADLFAFRFRSTWAGALTTLFMLIGVLPMLALQIQAVTDSISILTRDPAQERVAFVFCTLITLFAILFGARHIATRERHEGLVFAIAFESLVKLVMLGSIGLYALYGVFGGPEGLEVWLLQNQTALTTLHTPLAEGPWRTLLLVFFAAAIVMPHMFHMIFTENLNPRALISASWGLPLFLLLMSLAVPPILWAGLRLGASTTPEYYTIGLGLAVDSPALALAAFIGGISAASGLTIVMTLALSGMVLNHLVLPLYQPPAQGNIYRWLKWTRRLLIVAIIMASYAFYLLLGAEQDLSNLGIVSFVATLQFLPGALSVLYWPTANRRGFISGLIAGMLVWAITMLLPLMGNVQGLYLPLFDVIYVLDDSNWHLAALSSLAANVLVFTLVSLFTEASDEEKGAAEACAVDNVRRPQRRELFAGSPQEFASQLAKPLGAKTAQKEVEQALRDLHLPFDERRPYALRRLRDRIEANLSGLMGPSVAQDIVETFLPYKTSEESYVTEDIHFIESRLEDYHSRLTGLAAELDTLRRYHRQTLQDLPMGVCSLAKDQEVLMWNRAIEELTGVGAQKVVGSRLSALPEPWKGLLERFIDAPDEHLHKQRLVYDGHTRWLNLHKAAIEEPLAPGNSGLVLLVEDLTETQLLEDKLVHSERLASIGRLAAGVAHEIGNPITGIACLAQNLREEREGDGELTEISEQILDQTKRVSRIVQSVMSFAHSGSHLQALEPVCLSEVAQEAIGLLSLNRRSVEVEFFNLCDPAHWVEGDSQRLAQVLINLLSNARDASPPGGAIRVRSEASEHTVDLVVEDEGSGIPKAIMDQLFEPFFTTKDPGKGTGLGLALVYSIVEEHYGQITIESPTDHQREGGTRFRVTLPRHPGPTAEL